MHRLKVMLALLLLAFGGVSLASAAGVGTFSIEQTTPSVGVGQFGIATLSMDNGWTPPADSVVLAISWDPAIMQYVSTDWKVGNSVAATPAGPGELTFSFADFTNKYPAGKVAIAAVNFKGVAPGQTNIRIRIDSVRSHVGVSETEFTDLTASAVENSGIFVVGPGGGTVVPTVPVGTTLTTVPTVTGNVTGVVTTPITIATTVPLTGITTGITTGATFVPVGASSGGGSEDYTGALTRTPTVTATRTATVTATATANVTANATTVVTTASPVVNNTTANATATQTAFATTTAGTTARTTAPVNTTATRAGFDALPLAVAGLAAIALLAARRR